VRPAAGKS